MDMPCGYELPAARFAGCCCGDDSGDDSTVGRFSEDRGRLDPGNAFPALDDKGSWKGGGERTEVWARKGGSAPVELVRFGGDGGRVIGVD